MRSVVPVPVNDVGDTSHPLAVMVWTVPPLVTPTDTGRVTVAETTEEYVSVNVGHVPAEHVVTVSLCAPDRVQMYPLGRERVKSQSMSAVRSVVPEPEKEAGWTSHPLAVMLWTATPAVGLADTGCVAVGGPNSAVRVPGPSTSTVADEQSALLQLTGRFATGSHPVNVKPESGVAWSSRTDGALYHVGDEGAGDPSTVNEPPVPGPDGLVVANDTWYWWVYSTTVVPEVVAGIGACEVTHCSPLAPGMVPWAVIVPVASNQ